MTQLTFFAEEPPANPSASPDSEKDWMTRVATSCLPSVPLLQSIGPAGWLGRTSPAFCPATEDGTLVPSSGSWASSGMGSPTAFLTLNTLESPSNAEGSSLSAVLEVGEVPRRFYLSVRACVGYLRRLDRIRSQMSIGGLEKVEFLIALMRATARSGEATSGTPAVTSSSTEPAAPGAQPS
jgi:hypothetical protein